MPKLNKLQVKMQKQMITILIPMAGLGSRFSNEGFSKPKPFIKINDKMMIEYVLDSFSSLKNEYEIMFSIIFQKLLVAEYLNEICFLEEKYKAQFILADGITTGSASTVLIAFHSKSIALNTPVIVADCDNFYLNNVLVNFLKSVNFQKTQTIVLTFEASALEFSYVLTNNESAIVAIKEKEVISNQAICGLYYFSNASLLFDKIIDVIVYPPKNKEYYMSDVINAFIKDGLPAYSFFINSEDYVCVGTPTHLKKYLAQNKK